MTRVAEPAHDASAAEWGVYADALQESGDPRGELVALNLAVAAGMSPADRDAYVTKHAQALFGAAAVHRAAYRVTSWIGCLADAVEIRITSGDDARAVTSAFLACPLATGTRELALIGAAVGSAVLDLAPAVEELFEARPPRCTTFAFVDERAANTTRLSSRNFDPPENLVTFGNLDVVWPHAERVRIVCADSHQLALGPIVAPALRSLTLHCLRYGTSYGEPSPHNAALATARWPQLRELELRLPEEFATNIVADDDSYNPQYAGDEDFADRMDEADADGESYEATEWAQLAGVLANLQQVPLERLALTGFSSFEQLLETLQAAGLPATLVELDLSESSVSSAEWFLENKAMFARLGRLVLRDVRMTSEEAATLAGLGPEIVHSEGDGPRYRYVVGSE